jgi:hypothetical protein
MRSGLVYEEHRPFASLRSHVACYWTLLGAEVAAHRVLPSGCMDLVFSLSAASDPRAMLVGTMSAAVVAPAAATAHFFGVRFRPGEAFAFVGVSAVETKDQMIPLCGRPRRDRRSRVGRARVRSRHLRADRCARSPLCHTARTCAVPRFTGEGSRRPHPGCARRGACR